MLVSKGFHERYAAMVFDYNIPSIIRLGQPAYHSFCRLQFPDQDHHGA